MRTHSLSQISICCEQRRHDQSHLHNSAGQQSSNYFLVLCRTHSDVSACFRGGPTPCMSSTAFYDQPRWILKLGIAATGERFAGAKQCRLKPCQVLRGGVSSRPPVVAALPTRVSDVNKMLLPTRVVGRGTVNLIHNTCPIKVC